MIKSKHAVVGIYPNRIDAEKAVVQLKEEGLKGNEFSIFVPHKEVIHIPHDRETKTVAGAEVGIAAGTIVGGVLGWLAGVGMLAIPGVGAVIVAGPLAAALLGAGTLGSLGGLWGALVGLGIPEKEAKHFESRLHRGHTLLSVHPADDGKVQRIREIMVKTGAEDLYTRGPMA
ncbi:MAG: DUF3341 domain-containing protein [Planctomycetes bacterium]|nr:DUF3341 domain-containing protein [Planctomycetota bacterium]